MCGYPKSPGREETLETVYLCQALHDGHGDVITNTTCKEKWRVAAFAEDPTECAPLDVVKRSLADAEKGLSGAGIPLWKNLAPLRSVSDKKDPFSHAGFSLPAKTTAAFGIDGGMRIRFRIQTNLKKEKRGAKQADEYVWSASAPGYGSYSVRVPARSVLSHEWLEAVQSVEDRPYVFMFIGVDIDHVYEEPYLLRVDRLAARLVNARGFRKHKRKLYQESAADFARAFEIDPTFALAAFNLACAEALLGRHDKALTSLEKAVRVNPDIRRKARRDKDLVSLRERPDFKRLTE